MKKVQFVSWLTATGVGIAALVLASCMFFAQGEPISLIHTTNDGEGCHLLSNSTDGAISLFVFRRDPQGPYGLRQLYQIDIIRGSGTGKNSVVFFETGDVQKATRCLSWAGTDPETERLPGLYRKIWMELSHSQKPSI